MLIRIAPSVLSTRIAAEGLEVMQGNAMMALLVGVTALHDSDFLYA